MRLIPSRVERISGHESRIMAAVTAAVGCGRAASGAEGACSAAAASAGTEGRETTGAGAAGAGGVEGGTGRVAHCAGGGSAFTAETGPAA
ncbi:MAG TPA: hypothetical protein DCR63_05575, partial [Microbacterium sp.]|nr:hypothetical protein [Microbacterium sp.]